MSTPLFLVTGFLDSGKTTLIKETLMEQDWIRKGRTLLICCEEGECEYDEEYCKRKKITVVNVESFEELDLAFFKKVEKVYRPVQIVMEFNGMWKLADLLNLRYPRGWELQGVYSTVNGETLDMYLMNMRNLLMEQLTESELIVVNRVGENVNRSGFRRALKIQNPMAQLIFEDLQGRIIEPSEDDLPFDLKADLIQIDDMDFGTFYVDAYDHPEHYEGKELEFKAEIVRPRSMGPKMFVPVRKIMTCCADDVRYYGYPCFAEEEIKVTKNLWMKVRVKFDYDAVTPGGEKQPCFQLVEMSETEKPAEEVVYLG